MSFSSKPRRRGLAAPLIRALMAAAPLAVCGCATQQYIRSVSYDYDAKRPLPAERRVSQEMQDACYLSGAQYYETVGPPQIVSLDGAGGQRLHATQAFYCVGTQGGP